LGAGGMGYLLFDYITISFFTDFISALQGFKVVKTNPLQNQKSLCSLYKSLASRQ
jgi:hypothetical protein